MPTAELTSPPASNGAPQRLAASLVLKAMDDFCETEVPGTAMPSRAEWMSRLNASERAVRWALDELQRQGKVVRRQGAATYVAEKSAFAQNGHHNSGWNEGTSTSREKVSRTVAVIAKPDHSIFDRAIELLYAQATEAKLSLICRPFDPAFNILPQEEKPLGYILFRRDLLPLARLLQSTGNRVVLVGSPNAGETVDVPNVYSDSEKGGYLATRHLLELGHTRLAFLANELALNTRRWRGHQKALVEARKRGAQVEETTLSIEQVQEWRETPEAAKTYFAGSQGPTGVIAWNDHEVLPLLSLLSSLGLRVPQDVSVVGHDNLPISQLVHPQLTTVDIAIEQQLQAALDLLTQEDAPSPNHTTIVLPALIRRNSSARVAR